MHPPRTGTGSSALGAWSTEGRLGGLPDWVIVMMAKCQYRAAVASANSARPPNP